MNKKILIAILIVATFLRLWKLDQVPVSLFGDELDVGYQAYSVLKTGSDYNGNFMPMHFNSLAEWRTPLYLYSVVPTVALFGISPLGVRLPAAIFGILGVWAMYLLANQLSKNEKIGLLAAFLLAISPWHIQYSRAAFEVTQLLFFLIIGLYLFFKSLKQPRLLWMSAASFALMPWVYSTAKMFTPLLLAFLSVVWFKELIKIPRKYLMWAAASLVIVGAPIAYSTLYGGGSQRFAYVSVFTNPTTEHEIGVARGIDAKARGETGTGLSPNIIDRVIHNKFTYWSDNIIRNYFQTFSTDFLFYTGDLNLRHSIKGVGQFYQIEMLALILGLIYFFSSKESWKNKLFLIFWLLAGILPASITRDGGGHATRLILILPPLTYLMAYGLFKAYKKLPKKFAMLICGAYVLLLAINFASYQHKYWNHNPFESERWWHYGWGEAVQSIKSMESEFESVAITMADEPAWIFFAAHYEYDPASWQSEYPIGNDIEFEGFGKISRTGKFYFGSPQGGLYDWGQVLKSDTLFLASAKEVNVNLITESERTPADLKLLDSISYPSGEPAFYLFTGIENEE